MYKMIINPAAKIAQQTALRAAFLVDQAIQEKQVSTIPQFSYVCSLFRSHNYTTFINVLSLTSQLSL